MNETAELAAELSRLFPDNIFELPPAPPRAAPTVFALTQHRSTPNRQRRNRQQRSHSGGGSSGDTDDGGGDGPPAAVNSFHQAGGSAC